jgi:uncharacterized protein
MLKYNLVIAIFFVAFGDSYAASFDCIKAGTASEKIICSNPVLSKLDEQMFAAYSSAKSSATNPDLLKNEQISWIKEVRGCGNDEDCVASLYNKRINQLTKFTSQGLEEPPKVAPISEDRNVEATTFSEPNELAPVSPTTVAPPEHQAEQHTESTTRDAPLPIENSNENNETFSYNSTEGNIGLAVGMLLYILSFAVYISQPKLRKFSISTPFDVGCKSELSEADQAVKGKKRWIEFELLLLSVVVYFYLLTNGLESETGILNAFASSFVAFLAALASVVVGRFLAGQATSCPKCKSAFSRKCINSYEEPRSTYEKVSNGTRGSRECQFVRVIEAGVKHEDYLCTVCSHEWHVANQYTKQISEYQR